MFKLILNKKESDLQQIFKEFLNIPTFSDSVELALVDVVKCLGDLDVSRRMGMYSDILKKKDVDDHVRFFHYVSIIHLLHKILEKSQLGKGQISRAENMLRACRKKSIPLMSKIFVAAQEECSIWQEFLKEGAKYLLAQENLKELFGEKEITQLEFMGDCDNPDKRVPFHLFCVTNANNEICNIGDLIKFYIFDNKHEEVKTPFLDKLLDKLILMFKVKNLENDKSKSKGNDFQITNLPDAAEMVFCICQLKTKSKRMLNLLFDLFEMLNVSSENFNRGEFFNKLVNKDNFIGQLAKLCASYVVGSGDEEKVIKIIDILQNCEFKLMPDQQLLQLMNFSDEFCNKKITKELMIEIAVRICSLFEFFDDKCINRLINNDKYLEVLKKVRQVQQFCACTNNKYQNKCFEKWEMVEVTLFNIMHDKCLSKKEYKVIHDLVVHMSKNGANFKYTKLATLWDKFISEKEQVPIIKLQLVKEYMKHEEEGSRRRNIIGCIYDVDSTEERLTPCLCLIDWSARLLPGELFFKNAIQINEFFNKLPNKVDLFACLLEMLETNKDIFHNKRFRHFVFGSELIFYPQKDKSRFAKYFNHFEDKYLLGRNQITRAYIWTNIFINDVLLLDKLNNKVDIGIKIKNLPSNIGDLIKILAKYEFNCEEYFSLLIDAVPPKYFCYIVLHTLLNKSLEKKKYVFDKIRCDLDLKENPNLIADELQIKFLRLNDEFYRLIKIISHSPELSMRDFLKEHDGFSALQDFCRIFYGKHIEGSDDLSSVISTFDDETRVYWDMLICGAPIKIMRLILEKYREKLNDFSEAFEEIIKIYNNPEVVNSHERAFLMIRKYLSGELGRHKIKAQVVWILPHIIKILAYDACTQTKANIGEKRNSIMFVRKYYAVATHFPELDKELDAHKQNPKKLFHHVLLVVLGSVHSNISHDDLLKSIKHPKVKLFGEFSLFFCKNDDHFSKWETIFAIDKGIEYGKVEYGANFKIISKEMFFAPGHLQKIIVTLYSLLSSLDTPQEEKLIKWAGCLLYILSKLMNKFKFSDWMSVEDSKDNSLRPIIFFHTGVERRQGFTVGEKVEKKIVSKKAKSVSCGHMIEPEKYSQENEEFILNCYNLFFQPNYEHFRMYNFRHPHMLFVRHIQRYVELSKKNVVSPKEFSQDLFPNQWQRKFERHRYSFYYSEYSREQSGAKNRIGFRRCEIPDGSFLLKTNEYLCEIVAKNLSSNKAIRAMFGLLLAREYCVRPHVLKNQLPEGICKKLDLAKSVDQAVPRYMPKYMEVCNELDSIRFFFKAILQHSHTISPRILMAFAMVKDINMCIWEVSDGSELVKSRIDTYTDSGRYQFEECEYRKRELTSKENEEYIDILNEGGEYSLLRRMPFEPEEEKLNKLTVRI